MSSMRILDRRTDALLERLPARAGLVAELDQILERVREHARVDAVEEVVERLDRFLLQRPELVTHRLERLFALLGERLS